MRLIDADALKTPIEDRIDNIPASEYDNGWNNAIYAVIDEIDNAPTVDIVSPTITVNIPEKTKQELIEELQKPHKLFVLPEPENIEYPFYQEAYQTGYEEGKNERAHKAYNEGFKDGVEQGIKLSERPQGKWGKWIVAEIQCPNCFEYIETDCYSTGELTKCPNCGADMKGGAE